MGSGLRPFGLPRLDAGGDEHGFVRVPFVEGVIEVDALLLLESVYSPAEP